MQFFKNINDKLIKWLDEKIAEADKEEQAHKPYSVDTQNLRKNMSDWANVYKNYSEENLIKKQVYTKLLKRKINV